MLGKTISYFFKRERERETEREREVERGRERERDRDGYSLTPHLRKLKTRQHRRILFIFLFDFKKRNFPKEIYQKKSTNDIVKRQINLFFFFSLQYLEL